MFLFIIFPGSPGSGRLAVTDVVTCNSKTILKLREPKPKPKPRKTHQEIKETYQEVYNPQNSQHSLMFSDVQKRGPVMPDLYFSQTKNPCTTSKIVTVQSGDCNTISLIKNIFDIKKCIGTEKRLRGLERERNSLQLDTLHFFGAILS